MENKNIFERVRRLLDSAIESEDYRFMKAEGGNEPKEKG